MSETLLRLEDFQDFVGSAFAVREEGFPEIALTLAEAEKLNQRHAGDGPRTPFALMFLGPENPVLPQRLYHLAHPKAGEVTIFLVPVGRDAKGTHYQAIFN